MCVCMYIYIIHAYGSRSIVPYLAGMNIHKLAVFLPGHQGAQALKASLKSFIASPQKMDK